MVDFADYNLDEEFSLGDGTADTEGIVMCPYCGEPNEIGIDAGGGAYQDYVEDCQVCCRRGGSRSTTMRRGMRKSQPHRSTNKSLPLVNAHF